MKLGSHDSMTYLPVKQWYFKPFRWTARCQRASIHDQYYKYGAKLFDIRVRFEKDGTPTFAHGPIKFKGDVMRTIEQLNNFAKLNNDEIKVRVILESNSEMKNQAAQEKKFIEFCEKIQQDYTNLYFFCGKRKYDFTKIYDFGTKEPSLDDLYSSTTGTKLDDLYPYWYAKHNNKKNIKKGTNKDYLFIDFIDIQ